MKSQMVMNYDKENKIYTYKKYKKNKQTDKSRRKKSYEIKIKANDSKNKKKQKKRKHEKKKQEEEKYISKSQYKSVLRHVCFKNRSVWCARIESPSPGSPGETE